jgi:hypothetical protein
MADLNNEQIDRLTSDLMQPYLKKAREARDFDSLAYLLNGRKKPKGFKK